MSAQLQRRDIEQETALQYHQTLLDTKLELALCATQFSNTTTPWSLTLAELIQYISPPVKISDRKEGEGFLIGPCLPTRKKSNLPWACIAVIDADKSVTETGEVEDGAPPPERVSAELTRNNLTHLLYTTYSHGSGVGNRYRIIIPIPLANEQELAGLVTYYVEVVQKAGIPLALSRESSVWSQLWACPRVSGPQAPYRALHHLGVIPNPTQLARLYGLLDEEGKPKDVTLPPLSLEEESEMGDSVIRLFNHYYPIERHLQDFHYTFVNQAVQYDQTGQAQTVTRYRKPRRQDDDSTPHAPGVIVFQTPRGARVYSHYDNDVLADGHANDAYGAWSLLCGFRPKDAYLAAVELIQDAIAVEMNQEHPSIMEGSARFKIGNRYMDDLGAEAYALMAWGDFKMSQYNAGRVPIKKQVGDEIKVVFIDRPTFWLHCRNRLLYNGLVYEPTPILKNHEQKVYRGDSVQEKPYFNIFRGWGVRPFKGNWPLLEWHLRNSYFSGDVDQYEYYLDWCAHLVQYPQEKPGVAIALTGRKGWGKSLPMSILAKKLGANAVVLGNQKLLTGQFNGHLRSKLFVLLEEAFWTGNRQSEGPLKHLITDDWTMFEKKGQDAVSGSSYVRVVMLTNDDWVVPATKDERRYFLPTLSAASQIRDEEHGKKGGFFPQLAVEMENGGMEAFLWDMARRQVSRSAVINVPETDALKHQRALSLHGLESWLLSCLISGQIQTDRSGVYTWGIAGCSVADEHLLESLASSLSKFDMERNVGFRLQVVLAETLKGLAYRKDGKWTFSSIVECRRSFAEALKLPDTIFASSTVAISGAARREEVDNVIRMSRG